MSMLLSYIKICSTFMLSTSQGTTFSCWLAKCRLIGLSGKQEYFKGQAICVKAGKCWLTEYYLNTEKYVAFSKWFRRIDILNFQNAIYKRRIESK